MPAISWRLTVASLADPRAAGARVRHRAVPERTIPAAGAEPDTPAADVAHGNVGQLHVFRKDEMGGGGGDMGGCLAGAAVLVLEVRALVGRAEAQQLIRVSMLLTTPACSLS